MILFCRFSWACHEHREPYACPRTLVHYHPPLQTQCQFSRTALSARCSGQYPCNMFKEASRGYIWRESHPVDSCKLCTLKDQQDIEIQIHRYLPEFEEISNIHELTNETTTIAGSSWNNVNAHMTQLCHSEDSKLNVKYSSTEVHIHIRFGNLTCPVKPLLH